jgi:histidyl-tRNA synthetase
VPRAPRGTNDILPSQQRYWKAVETAAESICETFGFNRIRLPAFEDSSLFTRGIGDTTDVVEKEMYTFLDRGGDSLTLLPEGTASVCRAYIQHGMHTNVQPVRLYYFSPIFRYERPQSGRYRQHHQFGVEALGSDDPIVDAEIIELGWSFLNKLGLHDVTLFINSIGCPICRAPYGTILKEYYASKLNQMCEDCKSRYERAPLRLLDCKKTTCQPFALQAPHTTDFLCEDCSNHWQQLQTYLTAINIPFEISHSIVRGLDYYTKTVFEFQPNDKEGSQSTILAGGRYDGLIGQIGGPPTPAIGFGSGMERLVMNMQAAKSEVTNLEKRPVVITTAGSIDPQILAQSAAELRSHNIYTTIAPPGKSMKSQMRYAGAVNAKFVVVLGEQELVSGVIQIKDMDSGSQKQIAVNTLLAHILSLQKSIET